MSEHCKMGTITPILKIRTVTKYIGLSVLPAPSKLIEQAVYNQLVCFLEARGLHRFKVIYKHVMVIWTTIDRKSILLNFVSEGLFEIH